MAAGLKLLKAKLGYGRARGAGGEVGADRLQLGSSALPALREAGQDSPPGADVKRERAESGEPQGLRMVYLSLLPSSLRPPCRAGPPVSRCRRSAAPALLGTARPEAAAASSGNRGPGPCGTLQGILAAIPSMAKELVR